MIMNSHRLATGRVQADSEAKEHPSQFYQFVRYIGIYRLASYNL